MKSKTAFVMSCCLFIPICSAAQERGVRVEDQTPKETIAAEISGVVANGTKVELIKSGLRGAQGATAAPDGSLLFTERTANKIWKLDNDGNFSTYLEGTNATNSFLFDRNGRAIGVERMPQQVAEFAPKMAVLADKAEGHQFGNLNDLSIDKRGGIYFTDDHGIPAEGIKPALYYLQPDGHVIKIADDLAFPNGVILSPDEKTLYLDDTQGDSIRAFDVKPDGSAINERSFVMITEGLRKGDTEALASGADGLTIDGAGRLYVAANSGVQVYSPEGKHLGTIPIPKRPAQVAFAGPYKKILFVLAGDSLFKISMLCEGYKGRLK